MAWMDNGQLVMDLRGPEGNAFFILGTVRGMLQQLGCDQKYCDEFWAKATAGDYENLLKVVEEYVDVLWIR